MSLTESPREIAGQENGLSYEDAIRKGEDMAALFFRGDGFPPSRARDLRMLMEYGWTRTVNNEYHLPSCQRSLTALYKDFGISLDPQRNNLIRWTHSEPTTNAWPDYKPTNAAYQCIFNPRAITAMSAESPDHTAVDADIKGSNVIPLKHWSDVAFVQYERYCNELGVSVKDIRYMIQANITNGITCRIMQEAENRSGRPIREWLSEEDGMGHPNEATATFGLGSREFSAILATPNGIGPAYFLLQHQQELGRMAITAVTCFRKTYDHPNSTMTSTTLNLVFHLNPICNLEGRQSQ